MSNKQPNILLIMTDQMRGDCMSFYGHPDVKTPYLDTLAARGVAFNNAYSACPSCIAARAALFTGLSPEHNHRVGYQDGIPWRYEKTLAGELSKAGYYTKCVGKMHVHPSRSLQGFHHVELHDGYLHALRFQDKCTFAEAQKNSDDYYHWLRAELGVDTDTIDTGLECNSWVARPWCYEEKYHPTNWVTDRTIDFLRSRDPEKPFFLMASYLKPHPPLDPPKYYFDMYMNRELRMPAKGNWERNEEASFSFDSPFTPNDNVLIKEMLAGYYGLITHLDHQIGKLIQALVEYNLYNDTIIVFSSDHGEELGDHGLFRKSRAYEGSTHIPLIISAPDTLIPGIRRGEKTESLVELRDIMPTLLEIAGTPDDTLDGRSLIPILQNPAKKIRSYLHGEHSYGKKSNHWIVTEKDKFIWNSFIGTEEYFDLKKDPRELIGDDGSHEERKNELRLLLIKELEGRPEGFVKNGTLIRTEVYPPYLET